MTRIKGLNLDGLDDLDLLDSLNLDALDEKMSRINYKDEPGLGGDAD
jgi:hypothetical protein